jgi:hypothetical protein
VNFRDVVRILMRRRWILVPAIVLALLAAGGCYMVAPPAYTQTESYLLLYPLEGVNGPGNPFLNLGNGVGMAASVLATKTNAPDTAARLTSGTPGLTYTVAPDPASTAPILDVIVNDQDRAAVARGLDAVGDELVTQLASLQRATGAPEASWVTISRLTRDPEPTPSHKAGLRNGAAALGGILVLALLLIVWLERPGSRSRTAASPDASGPEPDGATPLPAVPTPARQVSDDAEAPRPVAVGARKADSEVAAASGER